MRIATVLQCYSGSGAQGCKDRPRRRVPLIRDFNSCVFLSERTVHARSLSQHIAGIFNLPESECKVSPRPRSNCSVRQPVLPAADPFQTVETMDQNFAVSSALDEFRILCVPERGSSPVGVSRRMFPGILDKSFITHGVTHDGTSYRNMSAGYHKVVKNACKTGAVCQH